MKVVGMLLLCSMLWGCMDADPLGSHKTELGAGYYLDELESGSVLLMRKGHDTPAGYIEGRILRLAVQGGWLAVERSSAYIKDGERAEPIAWFVIDLSTHKIDGPIADAEFRRDHTELYSSSRVP